MAHQEHIADHFLELNGLMPFEDYMKEALYHPRYGYYSSNIATVGRRGDFSTSATINDTVARSVVRWASIERKKALGVGVGRRWHVIEIGAGDGSLARDFLSNVSWRHRPFLTYHIVEVSEPLRRKQREKLPRLQVRWHEDIGDALAAAHGKALIFSNEVVDAFPVTALRWNDSRRAWEKLFLRDQGVKGLAEEFMPLKGEMTKEDSSTFGTWHQDAVPLLDGQRCEVHWSYRDWQKQWLPQLERGAMLTIDYGGRFPGVYHKRVSGTMRGYFQGVRLEGMEIYDRFGHQDLTCDVNFTDLQQWGESMGLSTVSVTSQRDFLMEMLPSLKDSKLQHQDSALDFLMSPYGAGKAFSVLQQRKGSHSD
ncbi:MAG: SAM-dependent MidA family methyltransferase [Verrucomicrobiales bacterium]|jgi:SAM-dependent MidA family methyltransferase